jgi:hypothetical protein
VYAAAAVILLDGIAPGVHWVHDLTEADDSRYGDYVTYYLREYVTGMNEQSDGLLLARLVDDEDEDEDEDDENEEDDASVL